MNALPTVICPETIPHPQTIRQLLLFFGTVFHYQPAEDGPLPQPLLSREKLVCGYAPAPFGNDLDKFRKLVADLKGHGDEYRSGYLTTLSQPPEPDREEGSVQGLLASLGRPGLAPEEPTAAGLWQARLYLRLAEVQGQAEEELNRELARSAAQEKMLYANLLGEEVEAEPESVPAAEPAHPSPAATARLLLAWGQLYLADPNPDRPWLLTTANPEAFALLLEHHTRLGGAEGQKILTLPLPELKRTALDEQDFLNLRANYWQELATSRGALSRRLLATANEASIQSGNLFANGLEVGFVEALTSWREKIAELAGSGVGTKALHFYLLPNTPLPMLFAQLCQRPAPVAAGLPRHGVVALLV